MAATLSMSSGGICARAAPGAMRQPPAMPRPRSAAAPKWAAQLGIKSQRIVMGRLFLIAIVSIATLAQKFTPRTVGERHNLRKLRAFRTMAVQAMVLDKYGIDQAPAVHMWVGTARERDTEAK
jgi:hypothetical protein